MFRVYGFKHCVLRGLGLRVFGLGLKQPSIEVQYRVLNFNTGLDPRNQDSRFQGNFSVEP